MSAHDHVPARACCPVCSGRRPVALLVPSRDVSQSQRARDFLQRPRAVGLDLVGGRSGTRGDRPHVRERLWPPIGGRAVLDYIQVEMVFSHGRCSSSSWCSVWRGRTPGDQPRTAERPSWLGTMTGSPRPVRSRTRPPGLVDAGTIRNSSGAWLLRGCRCDGVSKTAIPARQGSRFWHHLAVRCLVRAESPAAETIAATRQSPLMR
jgi:hypothetical protein